MRHIRKALAWLVKVITFIISLIVLYLLLAVILTIIPANHKIQPQQGVSIFIRTNGIHADFVLPLDRPEINWLQYIKREDFKKVHEATYITFGWGDKGFYIETPEWSDLKASTAFKALFFLGTTAMHVSYLQTNPASGKDCKQLILSETQYKKLINYILASFKRDQTGSFVLIPGKGADENDNFYEANGTYSFIKTCNTWLNNGLKHIGVRTATWAPFDRCIFYYLT
jgi:uncharacterized protein (TIGR02117 family)